MSDSVVKDLLLPDSSNSVHYDFTALHINQLSFSSIPVALMPGLPSILISEQRSLQKASHGLAGLFSSDGGLGEKKNHPQCEDPEKHTDHKMQGRLLFPVEGNSSQSVCLLCWSSEIT